MTQTFIATIAFSIGLLAFCAGAWLTIWATSNNHVSDVNAAKLTGYFVTILALVALVFTSYYIATGVLGTAPNLSPAMHWSGDTSHHHMGPQKMGHSEPMTKQ